jgi:MoxR-like ATPase
MKANTTTGNVTKLAERKRGRPMPQTPQQWIATLAEVGYFMDMSLAETVHVHWTLRDAPLLLEGEPGGGKTRLVEAIEDALDVPLYRLQCYQGIEPSRALYAWNNELQKVLTEFAYREHKAIPPNLVNLLYSEKTMVQGVFLKALMDPYPHTTILIDEIDKLDQEFEAVMLEFLGNFKVTVAEMNKRYLPVSGKDPHIFLTSNAGIEGSSRRASLSYPILRRSRRVLIHPPTPERQWEIVCSRIPNLSPEVAEEAILAVAYINNRLSLDKTISISEVLMWSRRLALRMCHSLTAEILQQTLPDIAKLDRDQKTVIDASKAILEHIVKLRGSLRSKSSLNPGASI